MQQKLPEDILPEQVRCALYAIVKNQIQAPGIFDKNGWLQIGVYGYQPGLSENYISTGNLYLCSEVFLILGLPATNPFRANPNADCTQKKLWSGQQVEIDHALAD